MDEYLDLEYLKDIKPMSIDMFNKENERLKQINKDLREKESDEERKKYPKDIHYESYDEYVKEFVELIDCLIEINKCG